MTEDEKLLANKQLVSKWFRAVPFGPGTREAPLDPEMKKQVAHRNAGALFRIIPAA